MRTWWIRAAMCALVWAAVGCGSASPPRAPVAAQGAASAPASAPKLDAIESKLKLPEGAEQIAQTLNAFAFDLFRATRTQQNFVVSPANIEAAFALAVPGARGKTRDELRKALRLETEDARVLDTLRAILYRQEDGCVLQPANLAYVQDGFALEPGYEQAIRDHGGAQLERADFRADPEGVRTRINQAVAERTRGRSQICCRENRSSPGPVSR